MGDCARPFYAIDGSNSEAFLERFGEGILIASF